MLGSDSDSIVKGRYSTYQLLEVLGHGGSSIVYKALDRSTNQLVAVKKMTASEDSAGQWRAEVEVLLHTRDDESAHPFVVRYLDHMQAGKTIFIVEEFAVGGSLLTQLKEKKGKGFSEREAAKLMFHITRGLAYIHGQGIVHRDLKGANVLVCEHHIVKLADFGLSTAAPPISKKSEEEADLLGSVYWMAPETARGEEQTFSSDVWSLGCLCLELLTGKPPFFDRTPFSALYLIADCSESPIPSGDNMAAVSEECLGFLKACLAIDPAARPSAASLVRSPWFMDARVCAQLDEWDGVNALKDHNRFGVLFDEELEAWMENWLFSRPSAQCEAWLQEEGILTRVISVLPHVNPKTAFEIVRYFAYLAERSHDQKRLLFDKIGETALWDIQQLKMASPNYLVAVFCACCEWQSPRVPRYAPTYPHALRSMLEASSEKDTQQCIVALHKLFVGSIKGGPDGPTSPSSSRLAVHSNNNNNHDQDGGAGAEERRHAAKQRLLHDHGLLVLRGFLEAVCREAFSTKRAPSVGWSHVDYVFEIVAVVLSTLAGAERVLLGADRRSSGGGGSTDSHAGIGIDAEQDADNSNNNTNSGNTRQLPTILTDEEEGGETAKVKVAGTTTLPGTPWFLALQVASRHDCVHATRMLLHMLNDPTEVVSAHMDAAGVSLVGLLLHLGTNPSLPRTDRLLVWRTLPLLKRSSSRAALFLRDEKGSIPLLAYTLKRCDGAGEDDVLAEVLTCCLALCEDDRIAAAFANYPLLLSVVGGVLCAKVAEAEEGDSGEGGDGSDEHRRQYYRHVTRDTCLALQFMHTLYSKLSTAGVARQSPEQSVVNAIHQLMVRPDTASHAQQLQRTLSRSADLSVV